MRLYLCAALCVACGPVNAPFGYDSRPPNPACVAPANPPSAAGGIKLTTMFGGATFNGPIAMRQRPGDPTKFYIATQVGIIYRIDADGNNKVVWLDLTDRIIAGGELGLLGIEFHPTKPEIFVSSTEQAASSPAGARSTVTRFQIAGDGSVDRLTAATEDRVLPPNDNSPNVLDQPYSNHNGGNIAFGPDGYLYLGLGDGGSGGDPGNRAQNTNVFFGKMIRIDVDNPAPGARYGIPPTNPFALNPAGGLPELYAWGLRNPWRWSFDRATGDFWVGDVGQNMYEEVDRLQIGGNYGWHIREGFHCYNATTCQTAGLIDPIVEYDHTQGIAVTGGYVYRGTAIDSLIGTYLFSDYGSGHIWAIVYDTAGRPSMKDLLDTNLQVSSFAEDLAGELYIMSYGDGTVRMLVPDANAKPVGGPALKLSQTGCFSGAGNFVDGVIPYTVASPLWSDGADKQRGFAVPDGPAIDVGADGDFDLPVGSVAMKTFSLGGARVETRMFMRHADGTWAGYTYEWADDGSDATLLPAGKTKQVGAQTWTYPSRSQCLDCHTTAAGHTLGLELNQLDMTTTYPATNHISNQVDTLAHIGLIPPVAQLPAYARLPTPGAADPPSTIEAQARAYLHANCSFCHRPGGNGRGNLDVRWQTALAATGLCDAPMLGDLGVTGAKIVTPGNPATSIASLRMHALDVNRMPPVATAIVDDKGSGVLDAWISSLASCP